MSFPAYNRGCLYYDNNIRFPVQYIMILFVNARALHIRVLNSLTFRPCCRAVYNTDIMRTGVLLFVMGRRGKKKKKKKYQGRGKVFSGYRCVLCGAHIPRRAVNNARRCRRAVCTSLYTSIPGAYGEASVQFLISYILLVVQYIYIYTHVQVL